MQEIFEDFISTKERLTIPPHVHGLSELGEITHINTRSTMEPSPLHYHSKYMEIHCTIRGVRNSTVMEGGRTQSYSVSGNEVFIVMPFELHSNGSQPQMPCEIYVCQVSIPDPRRILSLNPEYSLMLYNRLINSKNRHWYLSKTEIGMIRTAFNLIANGDEQDRKNGVQVMTGFLFNLYYMTPLEQEMTQYIDENIKRAMEYVDQHLSEMLNVEKLALVSGYSISRFKTKFKRETGFSPAEYITIQKVEASKHLLEESNVNITELAFSLGFSTSNYFSSVFKRIMGCTPREYRKQFKQSQTSSES